MRADRSVQAVPSLSNKKCPLNRKKSSHWNEKKKYFLLLAFDLFMSPLSIHCEEQLQIFVHFRLRVADFNQQMWYNIHKKSPDQTITTNNNFARRHINCTKFIFWIPKCTQVQPVIFWAISNTSWVTFTMSAPAASSLLSHFAYQQAHLWCLSTSTRLWQGIGTISGKAPGHYFFFYTIYIKKSFTTSL